MNFKNKKRKTYKTHFLFYASKILFENDEQRLIRAERFMLYLY